MQLIDVVIEGTTALLQHRFGEQSEVAGAQATRRIQIKEELPRDAAERASYREKDGSLYFPGAAVARLLREAGSGHKQKGSRKSVKFIVPAAVLVTSDTIPLYGTNGTGNVRLKEFEVDSRPVTIPATKGRIMRHRPRLDAWRAKFTLRVNELILPVDVVHQLLVEGGQQIGVGDFRPEKGGPFGTFQVIEWKERQ